MAWQGAIALTLVSLLLVLALPGVPRGPFSYDEADYAYAATQGWIANWLDRPSLSLVDFVRLGLESGLDNHHRFELSQTIRQSGDIHFYRHWHGPLFFYWLGLIGKWTLEERQMRVLSLLIPAVGVVVVYFGCLLVMPSSQLIAILASALYAAGYSVVASPELAPHQLFVVVSLAGLFCLAELEASREPKWWWWSCAWAAVSFVTLEVAFVNVAALFVFGWRCRSNLPSCRQLWLRSLGLFLTVAGILWPAGILKLEPLRSYIFMAYLALFRRDAWGNTTFLQTWQSRLSFAPFEWLLFAVAVAIWWYLPRKPEKYAALPFLFYGGLMFAVMFRVNGMSPRYVLPFLAPLAVFAGITLGAALQNLPRPAQMGLTGIMILLVASGTWRYVHTHLPSANPQVQQILLSLRSKPLNGKKLLAPQDYVSVLHYYFPQISLALYADEDSKQRALSSGGIDAVLSEDHESFQIEYLTHK